MQSKTSQRGNVQKWINVAICAIMIFFCLGFCSSNKGLYLSAITEALGLKRSTYSIATSLRFVTTAVTNVFFGYMVYRFGTKKLMLAGVLSLMISMYINTIATNIYMFCISEIVSGIGFSWASTGMIGSVINRWCKENTGTITGATLAANGVGGALAAQIVTPIIYQPDNPFGYRDAYKLVMLILIAVFVVVAIFFKEKPPKELRSDTPYTQKKKRGTHWVGISYNDVKKKGFFYGGIICIFLTGMCLQGVGGVSAPHLMDVGINSSLVATISSISSLCLTGSKLFTGFMYDKIGLKRTMIICCICASAEMLCLAFASTSGLGLFLAFARVPISAIALPLETVMLPLYASDLFGEKSYNKVMGIVLAANVLGYAVGTPLVNICYDIFGTYKPFLIIMGFIMLGVIITMSFVIDSAHRTRDIILLNEKNKAEAKAASLAK